MSVRTRFAPSPTGYLHIGGARTALFWGLEYDEGPFYQTRHFDRYREVVAQLLESGHAYHCYCSKEELDAMREEAMKNKQKPRYNGYWRDRSDTPPAGVEPVVRFRNPLEGDVVIEDAVKGDIVVSNTELDDLIIMRSDGTPTYNLTVVVDDMDMRISHVIRGDDHVNNTPRQINILRALGAELPVYAHLPMILGEDGKRLSKRHGAVSVMQYKDDGYQPEALLNYLARLGWSHQDQELFSIEEMKTLFSLDAVNRSGSVFDNKKLDWVSQHHLQNTPKAALASALQPYIDAIGVKVSTSPELADVADLLRDRSKTLIDMAKAASYFYQAPAEYDAKASKKQFKAASAPVLSAVSAAFSDLTVWDAESIQAAMDSTVEKLEIGYGKLGQPLRLAVTGGTASPEMDRTLALIGKDAVLQRIKAAIGVCENAPEA